MKHPDRDPHYDRQYKYDPVRESPGCLGRISMILIILGAMAYYLLS